ncbi:SDR family oxidoreductase [Spongiibacter sp. KMU-166]|uniref:SDR family oxidoreductase n=1 Tax=Spongiibacter thalassae TaxID=2721624 RepID=A0ABX1GBG9_9GAMM|nr:SDR family oxidoreductase [Spongiibacter thalassae]NKI15847.1 SDR family oxidoreductase [Spongiibacter thalassae]
MKNFNNKVVAITGAGSGIGQALAINLSQLGACLALADINEAGLAKTQALLNIGLRVCSHNVDVANKDAVYQWADDVVAYHGHVDVLINNAGVAANAPIESLDYDDFNWAFNIVFYGVLYGCKAFLPYLKQRPDAHIINLSSLVGFIPFPNSAAYNCSKHAVKAFSQTLMQELRGSNIHVTSVHPGGIKTNMMRNSRYETMPSGLDHKGMIKAFDSIALTSSDKAAKIIIRGALKNRPRQLVGVDAVIAEFLSRVFPNSFVRWMGMLMLHMEKKWQQ